MAAGARKHLLDRLRNAHAMEKQAERMLEGQIGRLEHYPDLRRKLEEHLAETRQQEKQMVQFISRCGANSAAVTNAMGRMLAFGQALNSILTEDEVVRGSLGSYTFEQMEIASYMLLISAAEAAGDRTIATTCRRILAEEQAMAKWLADHMPQLVRVYLPDGQPAAKR
jgi:ferritin-like metal-binding protein YciE